MQKYNLQKNPLEETKIFQDIITYNQSQVSTQANISSFKNPHTKIDLLRKGPKFIKLLCFIMNLNTISLTWKAQHWTTQDWKLKLYIVEGALNHEHKRNHFHFA
jgi:hypothetical protein